ncbi:MAG: hypothetical protein AAB974_02985 [Patescibacteria group bacterium]
MRSLFLALAFCASGCGARSGLECPEVPVRIADAGIPDAPLPVDGGTDAGSDAGVDAGPPAPTCVEPEPGRPVDCSFYLSTGPGGGCFCRTCPPRSDDRDLAPGSLVRGTSSFASHVVYVIGRDGRRHVFPSPLELASWLGDASSAGPTHRWGDGEDRNHICAHIVQVPDDVLSAYPLSDRNVTVRPGTYIVTIDTVPTEWAIDRGGVLREMTPEISEEIWPFSARRRVRIVDDALFGSYVLGSPVTSAADYDLDALARVTLLDDLEARP